MIGSNPLKLILNNPNISPINVKASNLFAPSEKSFTLVGFLIETEGNDSET